MTTYYVGPGGSDGANGLTWANRKLTLNGAEDIPVVANDIVYVGPGTYREMLTVDVAGSSGQPITYIGDVTGENTDGIGGIVRVTGLDSDDGMPTRSRCIWNNGFAYRTFRGFYFDNVGTTGSYGLYACYGMSNLVIEQCVFDNSVDDVSSSNTGIDIDNRGIFGANNIIRKCIFYHRVDGINIEARPTGDLDIDLLVENCLFMANQRGLYAVRSYGITARNCTFYGNYFGVVYDADSAVTNYIYNCIFANATTNQHIANYSPSVLVDNYNVETVDGDTNLTGANNINEFVHFERPILLNGFKMVPLSFPFKMVRTRPTDRLGDSSAPSDDIYGLVRPVTNGKKTPGALHCQQIERETTTIQTGESSIKLEDAQRYTFLIILSGNTKHTITVSVYREANYTGTLPQIVVRRPGQSAVTTTDTGSSGQWNKLTLQFTPGASERWGQVEFVSNNTAGSGSYAVFFDNYRIKT